LTWFDSSIEADRLLAGASRRARAAYPVVLPVVVPVSLVAAFLVYSFRRIVQPDTWVALVSGREVALHGIPTVERLTALAHGHRWIDQQWLSQLLLYIVERVGGVGAVVALGVAAYLVALAVAGFAAQSQGASPYALLFWLPAAFLVDPSGAGVRTQSLVIPLFSILVWLMVRDPNLQRRSSLLALPVLCLWANLHGSVVLAAAVVAAHGLQGLVRRRGSWRISAALVLLAPTTIFASPYAVELPSYYRLLLVDPPFGRQIAEWQRTTPGTAPLFFVIVAVCGVLLCARWRRLGPAQAVLLTVTFVGALGAVRATLWFALAALAVMPPLTSRGRRKEEFATVGATATAAVVVAAVLAGLAWSARQSYAGPSRIVETLRGVPRGTEILADYPVADWVLWEAPNLRGKVEFDARAELLTPRQWHDVMHFPAPITQRRLLIVTDQPDMTRRLEREPRWRTLSAAGGIYLFVPSSRTRGP
jgi:hypothetical protein